MWNSWQNSGTEDKMIEQMTGRQDRKLVKKYVTG